jgi:hypothetical protein
MMPGIGATGAGRNRNRPSRLWCVGGSGTLVFVFTLVTLTLTVASTALAVFSVPSAPVSTIAAENEKAGDSGLFRAFGRTGSSISAYVSTPSIERGGTMRFFISSASRYVDLKIYRLGWYGGVRARLVRAVAHLAVPSQGRWMPGTFGLTDCRDCTYDPATGLLQLGWSPAYALTLDPQWPSGNYYAVFTDSQTKDNSIAYFVVRDDPARTPVLMVMPVLTYFAYNNWGGKSLYQSNSFGPKTVTGSTAAAKVSLARPLPPLASPYDWQEVALAERLGLDVSYATSVDVDQSPGLLTGHRLTISVGHDEYWTANIRTAFDEARDSGVNLAFLGGNDADWQTRIEYAVDGSIVMVVYRNLAIDPISRSKPSAATVHFSAQVVGRPQSLLTGTSYAGALVRSAPLVLSSAVPSWMLASTILHPGDIIANAVDGECDTAASASPRPSGLVVVGSATVALTPDGRQAECDTVFYVASSGAQIFNAADLGWATRLFEGLRPTELSLMTINVLVRLAG